MIGRALALLAPLLILPRPLTAAWTETAGDGLVIITVETAASRGATDRTKAELRLWSAYGLTEGVTLLGQAMIKSLTPDAGRFKAAMIGGRLRLGGGGRWVLSAEVRGSGGDLGQFGTGAAERAGIDSAVAFGHSLDWTGWPGFSVTELGWHQPAGPGARRAVSGQTFGFDLSPDWQMITETRIERAPLSGVTEWRSQISARFAVTRGIAVQIGPYLRLHAEAGQATERETGGFLGLWLRY